MEYPLESMSKNRTDNSLTSLRCEACNKLTPKLSREEIQTLQKEISGWRFEPDPYLVKSFHFDDFAGALAFVVKVGEVAEAENHHPDISFGWRYAKISITTHAISGLSKNDFILAAKIDALTK